MVSSSCVNPSLTYMALTARAVDHAVGELSRRNLERTEKHVTKTAFKARPADSTRSDSARERAARRSHADRPKRLAGRHARWRNGSSANLFADGDVALLDEIADTILPATKTPGAKAAGVGAFIA
jgi:hypothetical protein